MSVSNQSIVKSVGVVFTGESIDCKRSQKMWSNNKGV